MDPREEGFFAYSNGVSRTDNPYKPDTADWEDWDDGYCDASEANFEEPIGFEDDGDALASAGWGTDEDYGGGNEEW